MLIILKPIDKNKIERENIFLFPEILGRNFYQQI
jgi:hypothetical protein